MCVCESCACKEVLLGHGGAPLLICNQVRQTPQPHTTLSPPSRLFPLSPSLFPLCPPVSVFLASVKEPILSEVEYLNYILPQLLSVLLFNSWFHYQTPTTTHTHTSLCLFSYISISNFMALSIPSSPQLS